MQTFSSEFVDHLNRQHSGGLFFKAATLVLSDTTRYYYADTQEPVVFEGHTYQPLPMQWEGLGQSNQMSLEPLRVTIDARNLPAAAGFIPTGEAGADDQVSDLLETTSLRGKTVILQILHHDLLHSTTSQFRTQRAILTV